LLEFFLREKVPALIFKMLSPATSQKDRGVKYQLYEGGWSEVLLYCIVDPEEIISIVNQKGNVRQMTEAEKITYNLPQNKQVLTPDVVK
jgi:Uma2 family endonuclease